MKRAIILLLVILVAATACFAGCAKKHDLREVVINEVTRSVFYAPMYVAVSLGYFKDEGMNITIVTGGGSDKSMTALLAGEADVSLMGPETGLYVVNEGKENHPIVICQLTKRDGSYLVGRSEAKDFKWEDLKGKSVIGGRPGGMPFMTLEYVLKKHGLTPGVDVEVINNIQFNLMGGAFEGGTGDYVTLFEPTATQFQNAGKGYIVANVGLESGEVPYTTFMVTPERLQKDPEFVEAFVRAIYRAQQWAITATDTEVAKAMQPFFPDSSIETLEIVAKSYRATDSWTTTPVMTEDAFTRLQDIVEASGQLKKRVEFKELVDNSIAEKVVAAAKK